MNKYNYSIIDQQFEFYQADGLRRFNASDPNKLLPSSMILFNDHYLPWFSFLEFPTLTNLQHKWFFPSTDVPEGSFIIRAHTPMSNLFSCLWFNEVDRFTPRDQLSFAYTYQKLKRMNPERPFHFNMFKVTNFSEFYHQLIRVKTIIYYFSHIAGLREEIHCQVVSSQVRGEATQSAKGSRVKISVILPFQWEVYFNSMSFGQAVL